MIDRSIDHPCDRYHNLNLDRNFRSHLGISKESGKISAQPHTTLRIQFLDRKKNDPIEKKMTKTVHCHWENSFFTIVWGCAEILPRIELNLHNFIVLISFALEEAILTSRASKSYDRPIHLVLLVLGFVTPVLLHS